MTMEKIYRSALPPCNVPEGMSLPEFLNLYNPDMVPEDTVILEDLEAPYKKLTYGGLRIQAAIGAAALKQRYSLAPGDTAIIYSTNSVDYSLFAHSIMWMGCVIAYVHFFFTISVLCAKFLEAESILPGLVQS
jgi:acyl-coenzyme A synthetase/AMP-(fatty) acid ligase